MYILTLSSFRFHISSAESVRHINMPYSRLPLSLAISSFLSISLCLSTFAQSFNPQATATFSCEYELHKRKHAKLDHINFPKIYFVFICVFVVVLLLCYFWCVRLLCSHSLSSLILPLLQCSSNRTALPQNIQPLQLFAFCHNIEINIWLASSLKHSLIFPVLPRQYE